MKYSPRFNPKKSPTGVSTLGSDSPSQYMRRISFFKCCGSGAAMVNQMWLTIPGPSDVHQDLRGARFDPESIGIPAGAVIA